MTTKPVIAVTTSQRSGWRIFPLVWFNLWLAGAGAVRWGVGRPANLEEVDGLIIGGGDDVGPELYGGTIGLSAELDRDRDDLERGLATEALEQGVPVLGICRGAQMMNVAFGGSLDQNAWQTFGKAKKIKTILPKRDVDVLKDTHLARICGPERMRVNALHTQAVDSLGRGLRVAARDTWGMIQAIERPTDPFAVGVQWHPEHLFYARRQRLLFKALVAAARAYRASRAQVDAVLKDA